MFAIYLISPFPPIYLIFTVYHIPHFSILLVFCYSRKTVSFLTRKVFLFSPIFVKSAFLQYEFLIEFSTLELSFLPCFSVTETFSVSSKCHCYRPNLLKCASPTVYWHQTLPYRFHCTLHHTMLSLSLYRFGYVYVPKLKKGPKRSQRLEVPRSFGHV